MSGGDSDDEVTESVSEKPQKKAAMAKKQSVTIKEPEKPAEVMVESPCIHNIMSGPWARGMAYV
jgi:hypothetical protein